MLGGNFFSFLKYSLLKIKIIVPLYALKIANKSPYFHWYTSDRWFDIKSILSSRFCFLSYYFKDSFATCNTTLLPVFAVDSEFPLELQLMIPFSFFEFWHRKITVIDLNLLWMDFYNNEIGIWNKKQVTKTYRPVTSPIVSFNILLSTHEKWKGSVRKITYEETEILNNIKP